MEFSTVEIGMLMAIGVFAVLTVVFAALYSNARADRATVERQEKALNDAKRELQQLDSELQKLKGERDAEVKALQAELDRQRAQPLAQSVDAAQSGAMETRLVSTTGVSSTAAAAGDEAETTFFSTASLPVDANSDEGLPYLTIKSGIDEGKKHVLRPGGTTVGRSSDSDIQLKDPAASRLHAEIFFADGHYRVRDNESKNHTLCNGERIAETILQPGDKLCFADTHAEFNAEGFELMQSDTAGAISALEKTLQRCPEFIAVLRTLAFLLERDVARHSEAKALWDQLKALEKGT